LISIILPLYNRKEQILKSIRSIQNQSFKNIEIIIVDDASIDEVNSLLEDLFKEEP
jgi:glycosyltransferase involved in cell wall biosynthesis